MPLPMRKFVPLSPLFKWELVFSSMTWAGYVYRREAIDSM